jgi:DNA-binding response OmpR family regulator
MPAVQGPRQKWLVLVVEDDADLLRLLVRVLEQAKFEVATAADGQTGLALASGKPRPNLIISDIAMPDMDGLEMVRLIKEDPRMKPIPVIFLTAKETPGDIVAGIRAGARHYLTKPFRMPELLEKVRAILPDVPD